jgi:hypothetical protein
VSVLRSVDVHTASAFVKRSPHACWRVLVDPVLLPHWVPGLRRATVVATGADGLPDEIHFEFSTSLTYSLVYTYDVAAREVRFETRIGKRDGVRGFARVAASEDGSEIRYGLDVGEGRSEADRALGGVEAVLAAFVRWMDAERS